MSFRNEKPHSTAFGLSDIWLFEACKAELWRHCAFCKTKGGRNFRETFAKKFGGWESISDDPLLQ